MKLIQTQRLKVNPRRLFKVQKRLGLKRGNGVVFANVLSGLACLFLHMMATVNAFDTSLRVLAAAVPPIFPRDVHAPYN